MKVEMGLTEARLENSKRKMESDLRAELEKEVSADVCINSQVPKTYSN